MNCRPHRFASSILCKSQSISIRCHIREFEIYPKGVPPPRPKSIHRSWFLKHCHIFQNKVVNLLVCVACFGVYYRCPRIRWQILALHNGHLRRRLTLKSVSYRLALRTDLPPFLDITHSGKFCRKRSTRKEVTGVKEDSQDQQHDHGSGPTDRMQVLQPLQSKPRTGTPVVLLILSKNQGDDENVRRKAP